MSSADTRASGPRILFVAEAVTLAHVARPRVLAEALDRNRYDVQFAAAPTFDAALEGFASQRWPLVSIPPERFIKALAGGRPIYDVPTLESYVLDDLALLDRVRPDLVVGDFRLSLAISAPLRGIPYAALGNAHWSPYLRLSRWPIPDLPLVGLMGERAARALFNWVRPGVFRMHARALNQVRKRHGLSPVGDLRQAYTWADDSLYLDVPELIPTALLPPNHRFIGPLLWEPEITRPPWWDAVPLDRPTVYLTLGSSGPAERLPELVRALAGLPINLLVATAGRVAVDGSQSNLFTAAYLPGRAAAARSRLVVCNGGSGTVYQALSVGVPVIGIPSNLDQHLTMHFVSAVGAGSTLRSDRISGQRLRQAVVAMLEARDGQGAAQQVSDWFSAWPAVEGFKAFLREKLPAD